MKARQIDLAGAQSKLLPWLQQKLPKATGIAISNIERAGAGLSSETFLFDVTWREGGQQKMQGMVLRCPPRSYPIFPEYDIGKQFRIMKALQSTDVPVPRVLWHERDGAILGAEFYVMAKLQGLVPSEYPPYHAFGFYFESTPEQRARLWQNAIEALASIHKLDWRGLGMSFLGAPGPGTDPIDQHLRCLEAYLGWIKDGPDDSQPILEAALKWLKENRYEPEHVTLCWGDPKITNIMYDREFNVAAVFDWEMARLGDPESDVGWFLFQDMQYSDGYGIPRLEGTPSREEMIQSYERLIGYKVKHLFYNEVLAAFGLGIIMAKVFKNFKKMGITMPGEANEHNTVCTQKLAEWLNLPSPKPTRETMKVEEITATVQFHLTGPGGRDWYLVCDHGRGIPHEGTAQNPNCTMIAAAGDWAAIQSGELDRFKAWTEGKLKIEGDMTLLLQLEDLISKSTKPT